MNIGNKIEIEGFKTIVNENVKYIDSAKITKVVNELMPVFIFYNYTTYSYNFLFNNHYNLENNNQMMVKMLSKSILEKMMPKFSV